jgi:RHS repeat-associated protein
MTSTSTILDGPSPSLRNRTKYTYDNLGRRTAAESPTSLTTYDWNSDNRLTSVAILGTSGTMVTFTYDAMGRRFSRATSSGTTNFTWNGQVLQAETNSGGAVQNWYTQGQGAYGDITSVRNVGSSASTFPLYDSQGNAANFANSSASITSTLTYDTFGNIVDESGITDPTVSWSGRQGYYYDNVSNLYYVRQRWYDPAARRFLTQDPLGFGGGDTNLFRYAGNDPVNSSDPSGQDDNDSENSDLTPFEKGLQSEWPGMTLGVFKAVQDLLNQPYNYHSYDSHYFGPNQVYDVLNIVKYNDHIDNFKGITAQQIFNDYNQFVSKQQHILGTKEAADPFYDYPITWALNEVFNRPVGWENWVPLWGGIRSAIIYFETGHPIAGAANVVSAALDYGLIKDIFVLGAKLFIRPGTETLAKNISGKTAEDIIASEGKRIILQQAQGVLVQRIGSNILKTVDEEASRIAQWYGRTSIYYQAQALQRLGDMAVDFLYSDGKLVMSDAGKFTKGYLSSLFLRTRLIASLRLGTLVNDVVPRNIGTAGEVFDPILHPAIEAAYRLIALGGNASLRYMDNFLELSNSPTQK